MMITTPQHRLEMLREWERFGYPIAYYLLEDETLAVQAVSVALIKIACDEAFHQLPEQEQRQTFKRILMKEALRLQIKGPGGG